MTDEDFDSHFESLSVEQLFNYLGENLHTVDFIGRSGYVIESTEDLKMSVYQQMYEEITGRE